MGRTIHSFHLNKAFYPWQRVSVCSLLDAWEFEEQIEGGTHLFAYANFVDMGLYEVFSMTVRG
jgi:hypothetical protein